MAARSANVPAVSYPEALPVSQRKDDIATAISENQVVIVAGETGSGKTTQIPKICLELGRGVRGLIGHTQPRRLAARTVAERIAEELDTELGDAVGYTVRFTDQVSDRTYVKLMTDGILLAEIQRDRMLRRYDTLIIDEAARTQPQHRLHPRIPGSAAPPPTRSQGHHHVGDHRPERFAKHFAVDGKPAPIVEVSGRTFPVEMRYRPLTVESGDITFDRDPVDAVCEAVDELSAEGEGDILVFLSGEREIRDTADALRDRRLRNTEIVRCTRAVCCRATQSVLAAHRPTRRPCHQRGRDLADRSRHSVRRRSGNRAHFAIFGAHQGSAVARSSPFRRRQLVSVPGVAAASPKESASACIPRRTSSHGRHSPNRRSCEPTSHP